MAQDPQMMIARENVSTVCGRSLAEVMAVTEQLQTPLEVPVLNNDSVRCDIYILYMYYYNNYICTNMYYV